MSLTNGVPPVLLFSCRVRYFPFFLSSTKGCAVAALIKPAFFLGTRSVSDIGGISLRSHLHFPIFHPPRTTYTVYLNSLYVRYTVMLQEKTTLWERDVCGLRDLRTRRVISFPKKEEKAHSSPDTSNAKGWKKASPSPPFLSVSLTQQPAPLVNTSTQHVTAPEKQSFLIRVKNGCSDLNSWWYDYKTNY